VLLWAQHFDELQKGIDDLRAWTASGHYVIGPQVVAAGLAELLEV
jgi:hypothetical protein